MSEIHTSKYVVVEGVAVNILSYQPHDAADIKGRMQYFDMGYKHIFHHSTQPNFDAIANIAADLPI